MKKKTKTTTTRSKPIAGRSPCTLARKRLFGTSPASRGTDLGLRRLFSRGSIVLESDWVRRHIAVCPRCQQRFSALAKVQIGLSLLKSQVHSLDLLQRANTNTVAVLHRDLRSASKAKHLTHAVPHPTWRDRIWLYKQSFSNIAACIALLTLSKIGLFSSLEQTQQQGRSAIQQYYQRHLDVDMADDLFSGQL